MSGRRELLTALAFAILLIANVLACGVVAELLDLTSYRIQAAVGDDPPGVVARGWRAVRGFFAPPAVSLDLPLLEE
jgi:hypothetical protein